MTTDEDTWRIGELARATGLTVRTLRYYDQIGLLRPALRNGGGHRVYTQADARVLYQIVALRGLGLELTQIRECLHTDTDPRPLITEQLHALNVQLATAERLRRRLESLLATLDDHDRPGTRDLLDLIRQTTEVEGLLTSYLSDDQLARLRRRHEKLGEEVVGQVKAELPRLYQAALAEYDAGTDPRFGAVGAIAAQIDEASAALSGGDGSTTAGVRRMWAERGDDVYPGSGVPWSELLDYLDLARGDRGADS